MGHLRSNANARTLHAAQPTRRQPCGGLQLVCCCVQHMCIELHVTSGRIGCLRLGRTASVSVLRGTCVSCCRDRQVVNCNRYMLVGISGWGSQSYRPAPQHAGAWRDGQPPHHRGKVLGSRTHASFQKSEHRTLRHMRVSSRTTNVTCTPPRTGTAPEPAAAPHACCCRGWPQGCPAQSAKKRRGRRVRVRARGSTPAVQGAASSCTSQYRHNPHVWVKKAGKMREPRQGQVQTGSPPPNSAAGRPALVAPHCCCASCLSLFQCIHACVRMRCGGSSPPRRRSHAAPTLPRQTEKAACPSPS